MQIIKLDNTTQPDQPAEDTQYQVIDIVEAVDADGNIVNIKKLRKTVSKPEVQDKVNSLQTELTDYQTILDEINGLEEASLLVSDNQIVSESKEMLNGVFDPETEEML